MIELEFRGCGAGAIRFRRVYLAMCVAVGILPIGSAWAQTVQLELSGTLSAPSEVEDITGEVSSTPLPALPFGEGDMFVAEIVYDASTPISFSGPNRNSFAGAASLVEIEIFVSGGGSFVYSAASGSVNWSSFDTVGPVEIDSNSVTGPALDGFMPGGIGADFEDPTTFFPTTSLPLLNPVDFPGDTFFLSFVNAAEDRFDFNSAFVYVVPEPSAAAGLAIGALTLIPLWRRKAAELRTVPRSTRGDQGSGGRHAL